jgi:hypothetical protein
MSFDIGSVREAMNLPKILRPDLPNRPDQRSGASREPDRLKPAARQAALAIPRHPPYVSAADGCESGFAAFGQPVRPPQQMGSNGPIGGQPEANSLDAAAP